MNGTEVGPLEADAGAIRGDLEGIALRDRSVHASQVGSVAARGHVGPVAVVPLEHVVAGTAAHLVAAAVAGDLVVARRSVEDVGRLAAAHAVGAVAAGDRVEPGVAVERQQDAARRVRGRR